MIKLQKKIFYGKYINLIPLSISHFQDLVEAGRNPEIWKFLTMDCSIENEMNNFLIKAINDFNNGDGIPFVIYHKKDKRIIGSTRIWNFNFAHKIADIGLTWIDPEYWGSYANVESKYLLIKYGIETLGLKRIEFKVDEYNLRSQKSLRNMQIHQDGVIRNFRIFQNGTYINCHIFSVIPNDWSNLKESFQRQLNYEKDVFWAGGFIYSSKRNSVFLHLRDGKTRFNPNSWAFFGGTSEKNESAIQCFSREIKEEIGIEFKSGDIINLLDYYNEELSTYRFVYFIESDFDKKEVELTEGRDCDWVSLKNLEHLKLTEKTRLDLEYFKYYNNLI